MQPNQPGDEALAAAARQGDADAFAALVQRYAGRLLDKMARITGDGQESEDLVQEAFLRAYRSLPQYRPELPFRPWLYRISTNLALDWCRRRERRRRAGLAAPPVGRGQGDGESRDDGGRWWEEAGVGPQGAAPTPEEEVEARDRSRLVRRAVTALPPRYRAAVVLHYYHELSYKEVAEVLGISHRTVGTRLYRAKQMLASHLRCLEAGEDIGRQPV